MKQRAGSAGAARSQDPVKHGQLLQHAAQAPTGRSPTRARPPPPSCARPRPAAAGDLHACAWNRGHGQNRQAQACARRLYERHTGWTAAAVLHHGARGRRHQEYIAWCRACCGLSPGAAHCQTLRPAVMCRICAAGPSGNPRHGVCHRHAAFAGPGPPGVLCPRAGLMFITSMATSGGQADGGEVRHAPAPVSRWYGGVCRAFCANRLKS